MEFSVNLSKLGIDPGNFNNSPCGNPFRRVLIKTRASTSFTAELKDFIAPFRMFDYPDVDAFTEFIYFCEVFPPTTIYVLNPIPTSIYTWTTATGNIVGSNIGTSIVVDAPGTYVVTQQLHSQCLLFSQDSVTMLFDSICRVLDVDILNFNVRRVNNDAVFQWQLSNNRDVNNIEVEYSLNNRDFTQLAVINAGNETNLADYSFRHPVLAGKAIIFYRIKVNIKDGRVKYSQIVALKNTGNTNPLTIFPNPTSGETWISFTASVNETAEATVWNAQGKRVSIALLRIQTGENTLRLPDLSKSPAGIYYVKIKLRDNTVTKKIYVYR
jgi:hypothetical protein